MQLSGHSLLTDQFGPSSAVPVWATTYQGCSHSLGSLQLVGHLGVPDPLNVGLELASS